MGQTAQPNPADDHDYVVVYRLTKDFEAFNKGFALKIEPFDGGDPFYARDEEHLEAIIKRRGMKSCTAKDMELRREARLERQRARFR